jgi:hypothetical protein
VRDHPRDRRRHRRQDQRAELVGEHDHLALRGREACLRRDERLGRDCDGPQEIGDDAERDERQQRDDAGREDRPAPRLTRGERERGEHRHAERVEQPVDRHGHQAARLRGLSCAQRRHEHQRRALLLDRAHEVAEQQHRERAQVFHGEHQHRRDDVPDRERHRQPGEDGDDEAGERRACGDGRGRAVHL